VTSAIIRRWGPGKLAAVTLALAMIGPAHGQPAAPPPAVPTAPAASSGSPAPPAARAPRSPAKPARLDEAAVAADLARPETIARGLAALHAAGPAAKKLAPLVEELLVRGLPPDLAVTAIAALGSIGAQSSSAAIAPYMSHRSAAVREAAAEALSNTRGPQAAAALAAGLRSGDATVRDLSAKGLRFAGDGDSVPDLLRALDRGELGAAPSIGALCEADQCKELLQRWELVVRWERIVPGAQAKVLGAMLARRPRLPDALLLLAVERARASESPSTKEYLRSMKKSRDLSPRVRKLVEAAASEPAKGEGRAP